MNLLKSTSAWLAIFAGWAFFALAIFVTLEVISRKFFAFSFQSADELGGYILAIGSVAGFSAALASRSHTRVDLIYPLISPLARAWLNALAYVALAGFAIFMAKHAGSALVQSYDLGSRSFTPLRTPLWIPQAIWFLGLIFFALISVCFAVLSIRAALRDPIAANAEYGPLTNEQTIADEVPEEQIEGTLDLGGKK